MPLSTSKRLTIFYIQYTAFLVSLPLSEGGILFSNILIPILAASKRSCNIPTWTSIVLPKNNELPNGRRGSLLLCPPSLPCSSGCSSFCLYRLQDLQKEKGTSHTANTAKLGNTEPRCSSTNQTWNFAQTSI